VSSTADAEAALLQVLSKDQPTLTHSLFVQAKLEECLLCCMSDRKSVAGFMVMPKALLMVALEVMA
jgi:hypothetical protein